MNVTRPKVPGLVNVQIKPYQQRRLHRHDNGYSGRISQNGNIRLYKNFYWTVSVDPGYLIRFKNTGEQAIVARFEFTRYVNNNPAGGFTHSAQVQPGKSAVIYFRPMDKNDKLMLEAVEVSANNTVISHTRIRQFISRTWKFKSWHAAGLIMFFSMGAMYDAQLHHQLTFANILLPFLAFLALVCGAINFTPVIFMLLYVFFAPFVTNDIQMKAKLAGAGLAYLYLVWMNRSSIWDFLRGASTPEKALVY